MKQNNQRVTSLMKDLEDPKYWDSWRLGSGALRLALRQEWDLETCHLIRDEIIKALVTLRRECKQ